jgi:hypothetical protein
VQPVPRSQVEVGQIYRKIGDGGGRRWRVKKVFGLPEGPHAQLMSLDDPTRIMTLAASAILDRRLMAQVAE